MVTSSATYKNKKYSLGQAPQNKSESIFDPATAELALIDVNQGDVGNSGTASVPRSQAELDARKYVYLKSTAKGLNELETQDLYNQERIPDFEAIRQQKQAVLNQQIAQEKLSTLGLTEQQILQAQAGATEAPIDVGQALTAGTIGNLPSVLTSIGVGAGAGAAVGAGFAGVGAVPGAIVGGIGGLIKGVWSGVASNVRSQQKGEIASTTKVLTNAKTNLRQIRMIAQADPSNADVAIELYNAEMAKVYAAQQKLKLEVQGNLNSFMDDGTEKLVEFDLFLGTGGYADIQRLRIEEAIASGVPSSAEQLLLNLQEEFNND